jgi:hypothetical protein
MPEVEMHRVNGEVALVPAIDAKQACKRLPQEWSMRPWPPAAQQAAQAKMTADQRSEMEFGKKRSDAALAVINAENARLAASEKFEGLKEKLKKAKYTLDPERVDEARKQLDEADAELEAVCATLTAAKAAAASLQS